MAAVRSAAVPALTLAEAGRIMREAVRDKSYQLYPMGMEAAAYLRMKRKRLTKGSYRKYESCLDKLARFFPDLELKDFEPPVGTQRLEEFMDVHWGPEVAQPRTYDWWYGCLARAGVVAEGVTKGERMHKARHTAGQRVLDATGNLKAVQKLLGHASMLTTADVYLDWDVEQLAQTLAEMLTGEEGE